MCPGAVLTPTTRSLKPSPEQLAGRQRARVRGAPSLRRRGHEARPGPGAGPLVEEHLRLAGRAAGGDDQVGQAVVVDVDERDGGDSVAAQRREVGRGRQRVGPGRGLRVEEQFAGAAVDADEDVREAVAVDVSDRDRGHRSGGGRRSDGRAGRAEARLGVLLEHEVARDPRARRGTKTSRP